MVSVILPFPTDAELGSVVFSVGYVIHKLPNHHSHHDEANDWEDNLCYIHPRGEFDDVFHKSNITY